MTKISILTLILLLTSKLIFAQADSTRTLEYYFQIVDSLELVEMEKAGVITDKNSVADQYFDKTTKRLNERGFMKYAEIKGDIYLKYYRDYHFLQSINFNDDIYVLYFSVAGFDDVEFQIVKWKKQDWLKSDKLSKDIVDQPNQKFQKVAFNYDEGPKNLENVKMFVKNDYLVMERSGLYHSLYDLRKNELLVNDESPWHSASADNLETMNKWIKDNIHSKIEEKINASR
ncbi:MAG: hypothetical protein IPO85_15675 [Saprospiraceae bacterium]|jgi:hypothetical protein|uniref:DUF4136 domain-containing protein n=1 Tax=Candidatus Defluviibacterium haderslevense TaxID=2981993 RepID=A0A9D7SBJ4_9BACT|nr:hypothetical protein [Candidatus Defluviibacterium haderslevense]MCI1267832.1 hypothetical protein [Saprospiraceae bacterium]